MQPSQAHAEELISSYKRAHALMRSTGSMGTASSTKPAVAAGAAAGADSRPRRDRRSRRPPLTPPVWRWSSGTSATSCASETAGMWVPVEDSIEDGEEVWDELWKKFDGGLGYSEPVRSLSVMVRHKCARCVCVGVCVCARRFQHLGGDIAADVQRVVRASQVRPASR